MTTERSVRGRFAIRVLQSADCALRSTDGELVRGLSTEGRPTTDLHLLDSERMPAPAVDMKRITVKTVAIVLAALGTAYATWGLSVGG